MEISWLTMLYGWPETFLRLTIGSATIRFMPVARSAPVSWAALLV